MKDNPKRLEIIKAYADIIETRGFEGASLGAVAQQLSIPQSLIFHYFLNKDDLTVQTAEYVAELCLHSYDRAWPKRGDFSDASFHALIDYILEVHRNRRRTISPQLYFAMIYLLPRQKQVMQHFCDLTDALVVRLSEALGGFAAAGIIRTESPELSARSLLCLADGILCYEDLTPPEGRAAFVATQKSLFLQSVDYQPIVSA